MTRLTLELDTDKATAPVAVAVKRILKILGRVYHIRVVKHTLTDRDRKLAHGD